jgi:hypothetical protein
MKLATIADWVAQAQARPGKLDGTAVPGFTEFVLDHFENTAGLDLQKIPFQCPSWLLSGVANAR